MTADTNTVYLFDTQRYGDTLRRDAAAASGAHRAHSDDRAPAMSARAPSRARCSRSTPTSAVRAARDALDENPCSMTAGGR